MGGLSTLGLPVLAGPSGEAVDITALSFLAKRALEELAKLEEVPGAATFLPPRRPGGRGRRGGGSCRNPLPLFPPGLPARLALGNLDIIFTDPSSLAVLSCVGLLHAVVRQRIHEHASVPEAFGLFLNFLREGGPRLLRARVPLARAVRTWKLDNPTCPCLWLFVWSLC